MLPYIIPDFSTTPFSFYFEDSIYLGMRYHEHLYVLVESFVVQRESQAFALSLSLLHLNIESVITQPVLVGNRCYKVWAEVCAYEENGFLKSGNSSTAKCLSMPAYPMAC